MTLSKRYLWGERVDELLAQEDVTKGLSATDRVLWPIVDHLGTVRDLVKQDGTVATHFVYNAFGGVVSGDTSLTRYLFTSREYDTDTGLQYNRARWYDANVGRWISEDPLGFAAGDVNTARYVGNGVVEGTDPSGYVPPNYDGPPFDPNMAKVREYQRNPPADDTPAKGTRLQLPTEYEGQGEVTVTVVGQPDTNAPIEADKKIAVFVSDKTVIGDALWLRLKLRFPDVQTDVDEWEDVRDGLMRYPPHSVDYPVLSGHGGGGGVATSHEWLTAENLTHSKHDEEIVSDIKSRLAKGAKIVLLACGQGYSDAARHAQDLANRFDLPVIVNNATVDRGSHGNGMWFQIDPENATSPDAESMEGETQQR